MEKISGEEDEKSGGVEVWMRMSNCEKEDKGVFVENVSANEIIAADNFCKIKKDTHLHVCLFFV